MDLWQRTDFCQKLLYFYENFVSAEEPHVKSWFDVPITQMFIFILFESVGGLFEGCFFPVSILKEKIFSLCLNLLLKVY